MGAYAQISEEQHPLTVKVAEDAYGNVGSITAIPDNSDDDKTLYSYYLNNYETLGLGEWLGAKYNVYAEDGTSEGGVFQTVAETLDLVDENGQDAPADHAERLRQLRAPRARLPAGRPEPPENRK